MQMSWHSIVDYVPLHMHAKPHTRTLSINEDIRGGPNEPPPAVRRLKKVGWNRVNSSLNLFVFL